MSNGCLIFLRVWGYCLCHVVNCIQIYSLLNYFVYASYHFDFQYHFILFCIQIHAYFSEVFPQSLQDLSYQLGTNSSHQIRVQKCWCFVICGTYFLVSKISSTVLLNMTLFFFCLLIFPGYRSDPVFISRPTISVYSSDVSQDLALF